MFYNSEINYIIYTTPSPPNYNKIYVLRGIKYLAAIELRKEGQLLILEKENQLFNLEKITRKKA
jgi:hypothetical protein